MSIRFLQRSHCGYFFSPKYFSKKSFLVEADKYLKTQGGNITGADVGCISNISFNMKRSVHFAVQDDWREDLRIPWLIPWLVTRMLQGWAGIPVPDHSREYRPPIPIPKVWEWVFHSRSRSQKLGMQFSIPVPKIWECNFPFPFPLPGLDYHFGNRVGVEFKSWE